jgi:hypothetical protein
VLAASRTVAGVPPVLLGHRRADRIDASTVPARLRGNGPAQAIGVSPTGTSGTVLLAARLASTGEEWLDEGRRPNHRRLWPVGYVFKGAWYSPRVSPRWLRRCVCEPVIEFREVVRSLVVTAVRSNKAVPGQGCDVVPAEVECLCDGDIVLDQVVFHERRII